MLRRRRLPPATAYAEMGYTACFEPAILPVNARQAHMEMGDTPIVDKGGYALLGNDDFLLHLLAAGRATRNSSTTTWRGTLHATAVHRHQRWSIREVFSAFKFNARKLDVDEPHRITG